MTLHRFAGSFPRFILCPNGRFTKIAVLGQSLASVSLNGIELVVVKKQAMSVIGWGSRCHSLA